MAHIGEAVSNAAPGGGAGQHPNPFVEWLLTEGWNITDPSEFLGRLAARLVDGGMPLSRLLFLVLTLHPQAIGIRYAWRSDSGLAEAYEPPHDIVSTPRYLDSPMAAIIDGGVNGIRRRLDLPGDELEFPILEELRAEGMTDYVAMPIVFSDGKTHAVTFASDRPGGFSEAELERMYEMLPVLGHLLEVHAMRRTAKTLMDTYLGKHAGKRVLDGLVRLGDGENIHAVIWFSDLRDSTPLADSMSRQAFLGILNDYFDCMAGAVLDHGGEVLRFIGDAALAIFPTDEGPAAGRQACCAAPVACAKAIDAARDARARIQALNRQRRGRGEAPLGFGLALHMGELTYGNIGVPERLEFTVIGAAANEAARIESLCKTLDREILLSAEFAHCVAGQVVSLGHHQLRGVAEPREIFTLA